MKRKFVVLSLLAVSALVLMTADASAWGWWRYRSSCRVGLFQRLHCRKCGGQSCFTCDRPYNAFSTRPFGCGCGSHRRGWGGGCSSMSCGTSCGTAPAGCSTCLASPVMSSNTEMVMNVDPSLIPFMGDSAQQVVMQMPVQQMAYPTPYAMQPYGAQPYGVQPVQYMPAYYPAYPAYPQYYYPMQPSYPNYGYGYGY